VSGFRERLVDLVSHYECEDSWYSCPKSPEGCANNRKGPVCTCGAEGRLQQAVEVLEEVRRDALEEAYLAARGGEDRFEKYGTRQLYWKGRSEAARDIRELKLKGVK